MESSDRAGSNSHVANTALGVYDRIQKTFVKQIFAQVERGECNVTRSATKGADGKCTLVLKANIVQLE